MKINVPFFSILILMVGCAAPKTKFLIGVNPQGNSHTEIVAFDIKSTSYAFNTNIQSVLPQLNENYAFAWTDWDLDGYDDLFAINRKGYKSVDVYILSGASGYKSFLLQQPVNYPIAAAEVDFSVTDWNNDKIPDLVIFQRDKNNPIQVQVLNGAVNDKKLPFHSILEAFPLTFSDPKNELFFSFADYNMDKVEDLIVVKSSVDSNVIVNFYTKDDKFTKIKQSNKTALPKGNGIYKFAFGEGMTEGLKDLFTIDYSIPNSPRVKKSFFLVGYNVVANNDPLPFSQMNKNVQFFTANTLKTKDGKIRAGEITTFNPKPMLEGTGPKDLSFLNGKWETNYAIHSNDGNSVSGLIVTYDKSKEKKTENGLYQEVIMEFEDGYSLICSGENGNIECYTNDGKRTLIKSKLQRLNNGSFYLTIDNKEYRFNQYVDEANYSFITIKNAAGYVSEVTASWSYTSFGGKVVNETSSTEKLDALFKTTKYLVVPVRARDFKIHVKVLGGVDWGDLGDCSQFTILPVVDAGCYRITGTTLNPGYDRNCNSNDEVNQAMQDPYVNAFMDFFKNLKIEKLAKSLTSIIISQDLNKAAEQLKLDKLAKDLIKAHDKSKLTSSHELNSGLESVFIDPYNGYSMFNGGPGLSYNQGKAYFEELVGYENPENIYSASAPSMSLGFGAEAAAIIGGVLETGYVMSLNQVNEKNSFTKSNLKYFSAGGTLGLQLGADGYVAITLNASDVDAMSDSWSFGFSIAAGDEVGAGIIVWINDQGKYSGVTFLFMVGVDFALNAQAIHTTYKQVD